MKHIIRLLFAVLTLVLVLSACSPGTTMSEAPAPGQTGDAAIMDYVQLPPPALSGEVSVEQALANRRSRRDFTGQALTAGQVSQLLWAAYGVTLPEDNPALRGGLRTTPSAGATLPLEIYAIIGNVDGIAPGVYRYNAAQHKLELIAAGDARAEMLANVSGQRMVYTAPLSIFYTAIYERTTGIYGERGIMYVHMEIGHSSQNVYLQAEAMGLGTCAIGAFSDDAARALLQLPDAEMPLYLMPVGFICTD